MQVIQVRFVHSSMIVPGKGTKVTPLLFGFVTEINALALRLRVNQLLA